ncbi:MAG: hypothetical protein KAW45_02810 [Thermoplasmatales archaeon]|nr:hypothetical protein [Thermoplasmatales archaeon]
MSGMKSSGPFLILIIIGLCVVVFSIFDIIYDKGWMIISLVAFLVIIIITIILFFLKFREKQVAIISIEEFEKTLKGGLYHYKCPTCNGIFAIKKSKKNNKKTVKMTCPNCGAIGIIPPYPAEIEEEIPEKKSVKANFKCYICGEGITVWAEGADLYRETCIYSCPFCGENEPLKRI